MVTEIGTVETWGKAYLIHAFSKMAPRLICFFKLFLTETTYTDVGYLIRYVSGTVYKSY